MQVKRFQVKRFLLAASVAACGFTAPLAHADIVVSRGTGTAPFTGKTFFGKPEMAPTDEQTAIQLAEVNAIDMYFAKQSDAATGNYENVKAKITANLSTYVLNYVILNEQKTDTSVSVVIKANLNGSLLNNAIKTTSATAQTASTQRSNLLAIFVARQIKSIKTFDAHVYKREDQDLSAAGQSTASAKGTETLSHKGSQGQAIGANRISVNDTKTTESDAQAQANVSGHLHSTAIVETGGSTVQRSAQTTWQLYPSGDLNSSITSVLTQQGYEVVDEAFAETQSNGMLSIKAIDSDYSTGQDLQPTTLAHMEIGAKNLGIRYLVLGTMDMGQTGTDPNNGNVRVGVTVNAKVYDLSGRFPRQAVVVGPEQFFGESSTEQAAQVQALKNAGNAAAKELANQMQQIGLR
jgi:hypothetical protein